MYAVIETGGKQYRVELGSEIEVDRLDVEPGQTIDLERVLLVADGEEAAIGAPVVDGARVSADVVRQTRGDKIVVFKYKPKARSRVKNGARADLTLLRIADIAWAGRSAAKENAKAERERQAAAEQAAKAAAEKAAADQALADRLAAEAAQAAAAAPATTTRARAAAASAATDESPAAEAEAETPETATAQDEAPVQEAAPVEDATAATDAEAPIAEAEQADTDDDAKKDE
jgi:large subunit ribosomal protein L21